MLVSSSHFISPFQMSDRGSDPSCIPLFSVFCHLPHFLQSFAHSSFIWCINFFLRLPLRFLLVFPIIFQSYSAFYQLLLCIYFFNYSFLFCYFYNAFVLYSVPLFFNLKYRLRNYLLVYIKWSILFPMFL